MEFLQRCIQPHAVTMFVLALICLVGYARPGWRDHDGLVWLLWVLGAVMAIVAWCIQVF